MRSELPDAIEKALQGDERCVLDTMRLVDLLLVLLFEGRKALPKSGMSTVASRLPGLRRMDSSGEKTHRQLIDCIRSKDTDALIDAIDSGGIEVNFMDDVGQTLLNWASAFGTQEMVEFLCERGADVNKGEDFEVLLMAEIIIYLGLNIDWIIPFYHALSLSGTEFCNASFFRPKIILSSLCSMLRPPTNSQSFIASWCKP